MRYVPLDEEIYAKLEKIAKYKGLNVQELLEKIVSEYCKKFEKEKFRKLIEVFCNGGKSVKIKGTPITVMRGELFVRGEVDYEVLKSIAEEHDARVVEEYSESGELVGYSIVPNVGFNGKTMDEWFKEKGISLLRELVTIFK